MQIAIPADQRPVNELAQLRNGQLYSWVCPLLSKITHEASQTPAIDCCSNERPVAVLTLSSFVVFFGI